MATESPTCRLRIVASSIGVGSFTTAISIQPLRHAAMHIELRTPPPICPAHVRDRHEERCRQTIELADLAGQQRGLAAESHRADTGLIRLLDHARFQVGEDGIRIRVIEHAQELFLCETVAGAAVAADADAEDSGAAALTLRLENAVENGVLDAFEIASAEVGVRER